MGLDTPRFLEGRGSVYIVKRMRRRPLICLFFPFPLPDLRFAHFSCLSVHRKTDIQDSNNTITQLGRIQLSLLTCIRARKAEVNFQIFSCVADVTKRYRHRGSVRGHAVTENSMCTCDMMINVL